MVHPSSSLPFSPTSKAGVFVGPFSFSFVIVFWARHLFFQRNFFFFSHHSERNEVRGSWVCQKQLLAKQILSTFTSLSGSPQSKNMSQLNPMSNPGLHSNYHILASMPSSRLIVPVPVLGPNSVS